VEEGPRFDPLGQAADDAPVVVAAVCRRLCPHDETGAELRLDRIALLRKTRKLDLVELLEARPFDREDELLQLTPS
jgi:hypothetical protein